MMWTVVLLAALCPSMVLSAAPWENHVLVYNFMDVMAQSVCTAIEPVANRRIWALRRECTVSGQTKTCRQVCSQFKMDCFDAVYVYKKPWVLEANPEPGSQPDQGLPGLNIQRFTSPIGCITTRCGPNYCCCKKNASVIHGYS